MTSTDQSKMVAIRECKLPGFYMDERGAYGIVLGGVYICCFYNDFDGVYNVTVDEIGTLGDFDKNIEWEWFGEPRDAINCIRKMMKTYNPHTKY